MREESPAQPSPAAAQPSQNGRSKKQNPPAVPKIQSKRKTAQPSTAQPSQKPALPQIQKSNCKSKSKTPQNPPKSGNTPDPNPIQFLSPHKEGATYLDDDRSRPCRRFLQNRFVCLLLKHNPFKSRAQPRANQSPRAHSPEPTAQKTKAKAKPPKTPQNPAKPGKTPDPNPIQFL